MTEAPDEGELCRRFAPRLRLFGLRRLRSATEAEDLAQQVLLTVIDALRSGRVREPERLDSFVLGTARRVAADWTRTERRRETLRERFGPDLALTFEDGDPRLDEARLRGCLEGLGERDRLVVVATYYSDERGPELAARLGLEPTHVRVIRHRAMSRLVRCMGAEEADA